MMAQTSNCPSFVRRGLNTLNRIPSWLLGLLIRTELPTSFGDPGRPKSRGGM